MLILIIAALITYIVIRLLLAKTIRKLSPQPKRNQVPDTEEFRLAVHEAGHAITAWHCTIVHRVTLATIADKTGGHVEYVIDSKGYWCSLVICLAGMAGESIIYGKFRSAVSTGDLTKARGEVKKLIEMKMAHEAYALPSIPPWENKSKSNIRFDKMFTEPLSKLELEIFQVAFNEAKRVILKDIKQHHRLVVRLLAQRTLTEDDIKSTLSSRSFIAATGIVNATFV